MESLTRDPFAHLARFLPMVDLMRLSAVSSTIRRRCLDPLLWLDVSTNYHSVTSDWEVRGADSKAVRTFEELLAGYVHSAYPYRASARDLAVYFIGDDRSVEFVS